MSRGGRGAVLLVLIVATAAALRIWQLGAVPLGLHNDEAWTGLNAREVLRDGYVGPYLYPSGLGQPSGPAYFTALLFTLLPQSTFTLRLSTALFGIATVALTFAAGRAMFDRTTGLFAAALLTIMPWHLHLSRTGFMVNAWPCIEMAILWLLFRARARARARPAVWDYAAVGALIGLGVYVYNAYPLFVPVVAVPFVYDWVGARAAAQRRAWMVRSAAAAATALWATALMVHYAAGHREYFWHHEQVSVLHAVEWQHAGWPQRADILAARGAEWARGVFRGGRPDNGDGLGESGHPLLDPLTSAAALIGLVMAARNWRRPACGVLLAGAAVLPLGALLTVGDGLYRRTFGLAPVIALLAALPLVWLWQRALRRSAAAAGAIVLALAVAGARNVSAYFGPLQRGQLMSRVYPYQVDAAARAVARLPSRTAVYFYSDRWGAGFETIRWLAPGSMLVDRSREFRHNMDRAAPLELTANPSRASAFVLLGAYLGMVDELHARYPEAVVSEEKRGEEVLYRIVYVAPQSKG